MTMNSAIRFINCRHMAREPWRQKVTNGPFRATCGGCGKTIKRSAEPGVFKKWK